MIETLAMQWSDQWGWHAWWWALDYTVIALAALIFCGCYIRPSSYTPVVVDNIIFRKSMEATMCNMEEPICHRLYRTSVLSPLIKEKVNWTLRAQTGKPSVLLRPSVLGPLFTKKTPSYQYRDSHYKPETVVLDLYIMGIPIPVRRRLLSE